MANALAGVVWKLAAGIILTLENENFETTTQSDRLNVMEEMIIFLLHVVDRRIYVQTGTDNRQRVIAALAGDMKRLLADSRFDVEGKECDSSLFVDKLNLRASEYARYAHTTEEGASFAMRCVLGQHIMEQMGQRDSKWIPDYIISREAPRAEQTLKNALAGLVSFSDKPLADAQFL